MPTRLRFERRLTKAIVEAHARRGHGPFHMFKVEVIHRLGPWRNFEAAEYATFEWADWFNNRNLLEPIGNIPWAEGEAYFYAALETADMAA